MFETKIWRAEEIKDPSQIKEIFDNCEGIKFNHLAFFNTIAIKAFPVEILRDDLELTQKEVELFINLQKMIPEVWELWEKEDSEKLGLDDWSDIDDNADWINDYDSFKE